MLVPPTSEYDKRSLGSWRSEESLEETTDIYYSFLYTNTDVQKVIRTATVRDFIYTQHLKYIARVCRSSNTPITKIMLFATPTRKYYRDPWLKIVTYWE